MQGVKMYCNGPSELKHHMLAHWETSKPHTERLMLQPLWQLAIILHGPAEQLAVALKDWLW